LAVVCQRGRGPVVPPAVGGVLVGVAGGPQDLGERAAHAPQVLARQVPGEVLLDDRGARAWTAAAPRSLAW
jgi:hypothetical protein